MVIFIVKCVYFVILLIEVSLSKAEVSDYIKGNAGTMMKSKMPNVEGSIVVKPGTLNKHVVPILPEIEKYAKLQAKLENFTDMENLYRIPESEKTGIIEKLLQIPEVQTIIEECKEFHVPPVCDGSPYRSMDGSCNNLKHSEWGKVVTEHGRLLPPNYEGTNGFRKSVSGEDLPSCRRISLSMRNISNPSTSSSALFTFFGQFVTHDMTLTPAMTENGTTPNCCDPSKKSDPFCATDDISPDDPFYGKYNKTCLSISRAAPYPKCTFAEKRREINKKSSFIDASHIYGNNDEHSEKLRTNDGTGKLRMQDTMFGKLLPKNHNEKTLFCPVTATEKCFEGGDDRVNQHTMLMTLQTIFPRLHNNMASSLQELNPTWDENKLFQESRRIVIAILQHVVYEEYLPLLIGPESMKNYDLYPDFQRGSLYNDEVDPSILTEFNSAAFRAHSMVPKTVSGSMPRLKFRSTYSNTRLIHRGRLDSLLAGASEVPSEKEDAFQIDDIKNYLYKAPGETFGGDMTTTDILRGRDVGLPPYTEMIRFCSNGLQIKDFSDLGNSGLMTEDSIRELMSIYEDVNDIDLLIGLLREIHDDNAEFGPTAICIASIQFHRAKFGDSFYFTHVNGRNPFSRGQMESLRSYSMARVICETTELERVRQSAFKIPSTNNPLVSCKTFSSMNLSPWKDKSS